MMSGRQLGIDRLYATYQFMEMRGFEFFLFCLASHDLIKILKVKIARPLSFVLYWTNLMLLYRRSSLRFKQQRTSTPFS